MILKKIKIIKQIKKEEAKIKKRGKKVGVKIKKEELK